MARTLKRTLDPLTFLDWIGRVLTVVEIARLSRKVSVRLRYQSAILQLRWLQVVHVIIILFARLYAYTLTSHVPAPLSSVIRFYARLSLKTAINHVLPSKLPLFPSTRR